MSKIMLETSTHNNQLKCEKPKLENEKATLHEAAKSWSPEKIEAEIAGLYIAGDLDAAISKLKKSISSIQNTIYNINLREEFYGKFARSEGIDTLTYGERLLSQRKALLEQYENERRNKNVGASAIRPITLYDFM